MCCALLGAQSVVLTDRVMTRNTCSYSPDGNLIMGEPVRDQNLIDLLNTNVARNAPALANSRLQVMELEWGNQNHIQAALGLSGHASGFDLIVGSDLAYHGDCVPQLIHTIKGLASLSTAAVLALPHRGLRNDPVAQFAAMADASGLVTQVLHTERWFTVLELRLQYK